MDIDRLRYFVVLYNSSTMREAADHLYISQPALSKAMKLLEEELGEQLFVHSGRRLLFTDRAKLIAERTQIILSDLEKLTEESVDNLEGRIRIGSFEVFTTYFMGRLVEDSLNQYEIQIRELIPGQLEEQISLGNIDIGITYLPIPNQDLDFIKITEIDMGIFGLSRSFKNRDLVQLPFVAPVNPILGVPHKVKGLDGWPDDKIPRTIKYKVELMETALSLCRRGLAVAYLPRFVVDLHNEELKSNFCLSEIKRPTRLKKVKQGVFLVKRKSDVESTVFKKIANALRNLK